MEASPDSIFIASRQGDHLKMGLYAPEKPVKLTEAEKAELENTDKVKKVSMFQNDMEASIFNARFDNDYFSDIFNEF